jgi:biopolymer transport protein ExbD
VAYTSTNNELVTWLQLVNESYAGAKMDLLLKGDNVAKYPSFKNVITALKKNDILKFQMITNPENAPMGSELWKRSMSGEKQEN